MMENHQEKYDDLIVRYLSGECTDRERVSLENWMALSHENRDRFEEYRKLWDFKPQQAETRIDTATAWQKVNGRIGPKRVKARSINRRLYYISGIAALLLIFIGLYVFLNQMKQPGQIRYVAENKSENPLVLPDSSLVFLKKGSKISFPERFGDHERRVSVTGEALFEVSHHEERRFVVDLGEINAEVLGTIFYTENGGETAKTTVSVISGKVGVYAKRSPDQFVTLTANEYSVYNQKNNGFKKSKFTNLNFLAWKTGILEFNQAPLSNALIAIADTYDLELIIKRDIEGLKITARFRQEKISDILETLSMLFNLDIEQNGREIIIR